MGGRTKNRRFDPIVAQDRTSARKSELGPKNYKKTKYISLVFAGAGAVNEVKLKSRTGKAWAGFEFSGGSGSGFHVKKEGGGSKPGGRPRKGTKARMDQNHHH